MSAAQRVAKTMDASKAVAIRSFRELEGEYLVSSVNAVCELWFPLCSHSQAMRLQRSRPYFLQTICVFDRERDDDDDDCETTGDATGGGGYGGKARRGEARRRRVREESD